MKNYHRGDAKTRIKVATETRRKMHMEAKTKLRSTTNR